MIPEIDSSTKEERENFIKQRYRCIGDCENCGICKIFRGTEPMIAYEDYVEGRCSFLEVSQRWR